MLKLQRFMQVACMAATTLTVFSCSNEELVEQPILKGNTTIVASFAGSGSSTRTSVNEAYQILWSATDAFGMFDNENTLSKFSYASGEGTRTATFTGNIAQGKTGVCAVYPHQTGMSITSNTLTMSLPATFTYTSDSNGPMYAKVTDTENLNQLSFKHMAALIKLTVNKIPAAATTFTITASNNIAGTCTANLAEDNPVLAVTEEETSASKTITVTLSESAETNKSFFIPLPIGTYSEITATLTDGNNKTFFTKTITNQTLNRGNILVLPALDCVMIEATTPNDINTALTNNIQAPSGGEGVKTTDIALTKEIDVTSSNPAITVPVSANSNVNLAFTTAPKTSETKPLILQDKDASTSASTTAINKISIAVPEVTTTGGSTEAPSLTITMPQTTVELGSVGVTASYKKVIAKTATNTIVVKAGVTIDELVIEGGNVEIYGTVKKLTLNVDAATTVVSGGAADIQQVSDTNGKFSFISTWDGISQAEPKDGNIYTAAQLASLQSKNAPNEKNASSLPATLAAETTTLCADIDLDSKPWLGMVIDGKIFDGKKHTVKNLNMSQYILNQQETRYTPEACIGFFAAVYGAATIKDITLEKVTIRPEAPSSPKWVGALVGYSKGNVTKYENCIAKNVDIFTQGRSSIRVGGLIGYIEVSTAAVNTATATLTGCKVETATIAASYSYGGLIGSMYDSATLEDCSTSNITLLLNDGRDDTYGYVSNFIGDIANSGTKARTVIIKNCTTDALNNEATLKVPMGGCKWCGIVEPESVPNFTIKVTENGGEEKTLVAGTDFNIVHNIAWDGSCAFEPKQDNNVYTITAPSELAWIAKQVEKNNTFEGKTIQLSANLDMGNKNWKPIGDNIAHKTINMKGQEANYKNTVKYFKGTFDGKKKTINNLTVNHTYPGAGLFGNTQNATIKNFTVEDATINGSSKWTAVVVGYASEGLDIEEVIVKNSSINMTNPSGTVKLGGIAGFISAGYKGDVIIKGCSVSDFAINGGCFNFGGLAGYIFQAKSFNVENCTVKNISIKVTEDGGNIPNAINYCSAFLGCFGNTATTANAATAIFKGNKVEGSYTYIAKATNFNHSFTIATASNAEDENYANFVGAPLFGDSDAKMPITIDDQIYTKGTDGKYTKQQQ